MSEIPPAAAARVAAADIRVEERFSAFSDGIELLICDVWGVVHNGMHAHAQACAALRAFRATGGVVVLVTNAPRPKEAVIRQIQRYGVPLDAFDRIVTSGDLTRRLIGERAALKPVHLGPAQDLSLFEGCRFMPVGAEESDYCVCSGFRDDETETAADYAEVLATMAGRGLVMICANPDLVVERGAKLIPCAGMLAEAYESLGGQVIYAGKPHRPVYEAALELGAEVLGRAPDMTRVWAIGDAIRTDIAGARHLGVPPILLLDGIHWEDAGGAAWREHLAGWLSRQPVLPTVVMERLVW